MNLLVESGELRKRARQKNLLHDLVKIADRDVFADVEIVTLKQAAKEAAYHIAWNNQPDASKVEETATNIMEHTIISMQEFVEVKQDRIKIGLNVSEVNDVAIYKAVGLLLQVGDLTTPKTYQFGKEVIID